jgi:N-acetylmuramic acid 6-phosphate etherase
LLLKRHHRPNLSGLATEQANRASAGLDRKTSLQIARIINREDAKVAPAVQRALPAIADAIDVIADSLRVGGRLIYVGTGTSGRIAALDAAECPPTFKTDPRMVEFIMAGGTKALARAVEADEDSAALGQREMAKRKPGKNDVVVGIAASGRTPFTVAAIEYARRRGACTVALTCNRHTPLERAADHAIVVRVGPEVISGSTRMKAGTAEKMVLNMLSTGAMSRLGYVYSNLMVNLKQKNSKLEQRAVMIVRRVARVSAYQAKSALRKAGNNLPVALVMLKSKISRDMAKQALEGTRGNVRQAISVAKRSTR